MLSLESSSGRFPEDFLTLVRCSFNLALHFLTDDKLGSNLFFSLYVSLLPIQKFKPGCKEADNKLHSPVRSIKLLEGQ